MEIRGGEAATSALGLGLVAVALASLALLAAGCGSGPAKPKVASLGTTSTTTTTSGAASSGAQGQTSGGSGGGATIKVAGGAIVALTKFASCMRSHGLPNFPDPTAQGGISITPSMGINPSSSQFQAAQTACQKLLPQGLAPSPAQLARMQANALKYSACMRSHGVPSFPDPTFSGGGISLRINARNGIDPSSPQFQSAQKACQKDLPGAVTKGAVVAKGSAGG